MTYPEQARVPLIQYWHDPEPPDEIAKLLASFAVQNRDMEHLVFDEARAADFIAAHFGLAESSAFEACAVPAMQADYLRYCAGYALGGFCIDADCCCLRPLLPLLEQSGQGILLSAHKPGLLANGFYGFRRPGHPLLGMAREVATELIRRRFAADVASVTGPAMFTSLYWLYQVKSADALSRYIEDGIEPQPEDLRDPTMLCNGDNFYRMDLGLSLMRVAHAVIGDVGQLTCAFDGVRIVSAATLRNWLDKPDMRLPYKDTKSNWRRVGGSIYRSRGA